MKLTLQLDKLYKPIFFLPFRRLIKLVYKEKVDILSYWEDEQIYSNLKLPAIVRLKDYARYKKISPRFNFRAVYKRDKYRCCYTGIILSPSQLTIDHVIPKSRGGKSNWENCVTCSKDINLKKADKTPDEAGLKLLWKPTVPSDSLSLDFSLMENIHVDWINFFPNIERIRCSQYLIQTKS